MSIDLRQRLEERSIRLRGNLVGMRSILGKVSAYSRPGAAELPGIAWLLASSYSDFEEVLKAIAIECDGILPEGDAWHRALLDQVASGNSQRPAVLSASLKADLEEYRAFRHFSRFSTYAILEWERMRPLVDRLPALVDRFREEVDRFLTRDPKR